MRISPLTRDPTMICLQRLAIKASRSLRQEISLMGISCKVLLRAL